MRLFARMAPLAVALFAVGCSSTEHYVYSPADVATTAVAGFPGARYGVPPDAPEGEVDVASFGVTDATPEGGSSMHTMHARIVATNERGTAPWTIDTREILMDLPSEGRSRAAFANASVPGLPLVSVAPGTTQSIDVYFPLPDGVEDADELPGFDILWAVHVGDRVIAERTPFQRLQIETEPPPPPVGYVGVGFGPYWWWDPFWPHATFVHVHPIYRGPAVHHVVVGPPHHFHARPYAPRPSHRAPHVPARPHR